MVNVIVCASEPIPWDARAMPVYFKVQLPELLPTLVKKSAAVVFKVTSEAAVPVVGLAARTFNV